MILCTGVEKWQFMVKDRERPHKAKDLKDRTVESFKSALAFVISFGLHATSVVEAAFALKSAIRGHESWQIIRFTCLI